MGEALTRAVGTARAGMLRAEVDEAVRSFRRERYDQAARALRGVLREAPGIAELHELLGLCLYRLGR